MSTYFIFRDNTELKLDVTLSISPEYSSELTDQPVESGDDLGDFISDHITNNPIRLNVSGIIAGNKQGENHTPQVEKFANRLQKAWQGKELIIIKTESKIYKNYSIQNFSLPISSDEINDIKLNIAFKQVVTAVTQFVTLKRTVVTKANTSKSTNNRHSPDKNKGKKPTKPANGTQQKKAESWALKLAKLTGLSN